MDSRARTVPTVLLLVGMVAIALLWIWPSAERGPAAPPTGATSATSTSVGELALPDDVGALREPVGEDGGESQGTPWFARGRVVDQLARPVPAAMIYVLAEENPFGPGPASVTSGYQGRRLRGRRFPTDEQGRFDVALPGPDRVQVTPARVPLKHWIRVDADAQRVWVDPPAEGIELRVRTAPHGTLVVRAFDRSRDEELAKFKASYLDAGRFFASMGTENGEIRMEVPVESPAGDSYAVRLLEPEVYDDVLEQALGLVGLADPVEISEEVVLLAGETREIRLEVP